MWRYLRDHPEIETKNNLPVELFNEIRNMHCSCPLCEYFTDKNDYRSCSKCPLLSCGFGSNWDFWSDSPEHEMGYDQRSQAAGDIVILIEEWEVK